MTTNDALAEFKSRVDAFGGRGMFSKSALRIRDGAGVIDGILARKKYKTILEIGTYRGVTAAYMARFCERVITIDLEVGRMEKKGECFPRAAFWAAMEVENIDLRLVGSNEEKRELVASLDFDFAFIDGDHIAPAPAEDFEMVKRCGSVLFHDYDAGNDVMAFVDTLPKHQVEIIDIFAFWQDRPI